MTVLHFLVYATLLIFTVAVLGRIIRIMRMPVHLRWELYPVPHEKGRAHYGGSMLEEVNWWTKPRHTDRLNEWRVMLSEIIFLKGIWEHNRGLWFSSFTLHFGLYLLVGELALVGLAGLLSLTAAANLVQALQMLIPLLAWGGYGLGVIGAVALLIKRLTNPKLRMYNNASHFFNLLLLGALFATGLAWIVTSSTYTQELTRFVAGLLTPTLKPEVTALGYSHLGLTLIFLLYFPFTHMTHAFVKYFTYHTIRWEDEPNRPGSRMQLKLARQAAQSVTWAAPHVNADGQKTWVDLAGETGEVKK